MKMLFEEIERPDVNTPADNWFKVRKGNVDLPFQFKEKHPNSFHPTDFAIWAAFYPKQARLYFSSVLDAFEYSWKTLAEITGEKPTGDIFQFVKSIDYDPWFKQEFGQWGMIFSHL